MDWDASNADSRWWFQTFLFLTPTWEDDQIWRTFSNGLKPPTRISLYWFLSNMFISSRTSLMIQIRRNYQESLECFSLSPGHLCSEGHQGSFAIVLARMPNGPTFPWSVGDGFIDWLNCARKIAWGTHLRVKGICLNSSCLSREISWNKIPFWKNGVGVCNDFEDK